MNNKKIGLAVEDRMHFLGLNQKSFAESLFMSEKELKEYLRGKKDFSLELIELIALNLKTTPEALMFSKNNKLLFRSYLENKARQRKLHKVGDIAGIVGAIIICICLCIMDVTLIINEINATSGLIIFSAIIIMFLVIDIVNKIQSKF